MNRPVLFDQQTRLQQELAAAEPMLWADIRDDEGQGQALVLLLGPGRRPIVRRPVELRLEQPASVPSCGRRG
jgi:hypothetical protein